MNRVTLLSLRRYRCTNRPKQRISSSDPSTRFISRIRPGSSTLDGCKKPPELSAIQDHWCTTPHVRPNLRRGHIALEDLPLFRLLGIPSNEKSLHVILAVSCKRAWSPMDDDFSCLLGRDFYNVGARPLNDTIILASLISTPERRGSNVRSPTRRIRHGIRLGHSRRGLWARSSRWRLA